jgi:hypothetical protein
MSRRTASAFLVATVSAIFAGVVWADVLLHDQAELEAVLKAAPPCCVIDARVPKQRQSQPLANTVPYREGVTVTGTGTGPVVVLADTDARAVEVGGKLATATKDRRVLAVKGGAATWRALVAPDPATAMPKSFVIPSNTCQNGPPLQTLPYRKP